MPPVRDAAAAVWVARRAERAGASGAYNGWSHVGKFPRFGICAALARDWNLSGILFHRAMADTSAPTMPFAAEDAAPRAIEAADPLEGDWSEGLRGPLRAHGIAPPRRLSLEDLAQASTASTNGAAGPASAFSPESASAQIAEPSAAEVAPPDVGPNFAPPALDAALAVQLEAPSESAPTPWSEPVAGPATEGDTSDPGTITGWDQPTDDGAAASAAPAEEQAAPPDAWAGASAEPVQEWQAESAPSQWQEARKTEAPAGAGAPGTDRTSVRPRPDPAAPGRPQPPEAQARGTPPAPEPGAAKELFGSVPDGASLGAADDYLGAPEVLASPEEVLRPVAIDHDDPDLPEATGEPARTRAQPLAAFRPTAMNALEMQGEHRVAVHTRGGRTLRGTMRDIDLSKSQFPLIPQSGGEPEPIYRSDVKAIFFMLAPGEPPQAGDGTKVRVTFSDGRVIEGVRDGVDAKHGFFLVPLDAARTNTRRIYVAREATSDIKDG